MCSLGCMGPGSRPGWRLHRGAKGSGSAMSLAARGVVSTEVCGGLGLLVCVGVIVL